MRSQRMYLAESSAEASAERSRWLATLTKKIKPRGQSTVEAKRARREQEKVQPSRKHVLEILHKPGATCAIRPICAWPRGA